MSIDLNAIQARAQIIQRCMDARPNDCYDMSDIGGALDDASDDVPALLAYARELEARNKLATGLIADLTDAEPCSFDHHGGCQSHGYLSLEPGETCPQQDAKDWAIAALTATEASA